MPILTMDWERPASRLSNRFLARHHGQALAPSLYKILRRTDSRHWIQSAVSRTIVPFVITALLAGGAGWKLSVYAPDARTLGDALAVLTEDRR